MWVKTWERARKRINKAQFDNKFSSTIVLLLLSIQAACWGVKKFEASKALVCTHIYRLTQNGNSIQFRVKKIEHQTFFRMSSWISFLSTQFIFFLFSGYRFIYLIFFLFYLSVESRVVVERRKKYLQLSLFIVNWLLSLYSTFFSYFFSSCRVFKWKLTIYSEKCPRNGKSFSSFFGLFIQFLSHVLCLVFTHSLSKHADFFLFAVQRVSMKNLINQRPNQDMT